MDVILFGASGMVGQGVLRECLLADDVHRVLVIGRSVTGQQHPKLAEVVRADLYDYSDIEDRLIGYDACFFCLGTSAAGKSEDEYRRVTYDLTLAAATTLARLNPRMTFVYVSGSGTDSSEQGRVMWARVKGATENALLQLPFKAAYMFRPAAILPMHGETSKTKLYRVAYAVARPLLPLLLRLFPSYVTTTEILGRAMLDAARNGAPSPILEPAAFRIARRNTF
ncbi:MAG TPA: NAD(P)H-binding protein [Thermoanaerobaculia bacterium]|nr:NAD(P)H-binding protein [Thermoanaerobaculia bacterium]